MKQETESWKDILSVMFCLSVVPFVFSLYLKTWRAHECLVWGQASWFFNCETEDANSEKFINKTMSIEARNLAEMAKMKIEFCQKSANRDYRTEEDCHDYVNSKLEHAIINKTSGTKELILRSPTFEPK